MNLESYLASRRRLIEEALEKGLAAGDGTPPRLDEAMRYAVFSGGKRIRPILTLAACEAAPAPAERALPFACAIELIHTYSLVHDDLPAMDDDDLRRGRPTVHVVYGQAVAILAGDALLTEAFRIAAEGVQARGIESEHSLGIVATIARAAGASGMVGGQVADLEAQGRRAELALVEAIHRRKTARLIAAAVVAGALAGGAGADRLQALQAYGDAVGLAFQIADDVLDAAAPSALTGKRSGRDAAQGKATYPAVLGLDEARRTARRLVDDALAAIAPLGVPAEPLRALARFIVERAA